MTEIDNADSFGGWFTNLNIAASGLPGIVFIVLLWIGTYIFASNRNLNPGESFTASSFLSVLIGGLMYFSGLLGLGVVILLVVMFFGGIIYLMFK